MEEEFWQQFLETGKITDYLYYKGMGIIQQVMDRHIDGCQNQKQSGGTKSESDYSDRHGACGITYR